MKKFLCMILSSLMILTLFACGGEEQASAPDWEGQFVVGFGRGDVTGRTGDIMGGFAAAGEDTRTAEAILNKLYMSCVAMTDETGNTVLLYSFDCIRIDFQSAGRIRAAVEAATGVPADNILLNATHSHSTPENSVIYMETCCNGAVQAATDALADRAPVTMEFARADLEGMSFVRHYVTDLGNVVGDNFTPPNSGKVIRHTTEADKELRVVRFTREDKKPIVMANWLGHASMFSTGSSDFGLQHRYMMSSDYVGFCQSYVEENYDCHFVLFMGASGNINPTSRIPGEHFSNNGLEYAQKLGQCILDTTASMTEAQPGTIQSKTADFDGGNTKITLGSIGCGSLGLVHGPYEMFDTVSMAVRKDSPFEMTFVLSQTNGSFGYMPTEECYDYPDCYEARSNRFVRGSAEKTIDVYLQLLKDVQG